ncbi:competence protein ComEC [Varunaivibrio sulfuroxidans]|uniref:Competence protein ComEC n=2 Tax=Varunaivibrio sulfuroxidans TaxID=1773489 RepID=A0A4R3JDR9_9PROT|nr:competence protein ComEC [Varunaivibrio sulfuroxidans]
MLGGYFENNLSAESDRWILWFPVAMGVGIAGYFSLPGEPPFWVGPVALIVCAVLAFRLRDRVLPFVAVVFLLGAALGFSAAQVRTKAVSSPVLDRAYGPVIVSGRVLSVELLGKVHRVVLDRVQIPALAPRDTPERVRIRLNARGRSAQSDAGGKNNLVIAPGVWIDVLAVLRPPSPPVAPGAFDFQRRAYFQRLGAVGYGLGPARLYPPRDETFSFAFFAAVERLRQRISQTVIAHMGTDSGAMGAALMTGERGSIAPEVLTAMRDSGLAHLLAISGLHVGLVAGLLFSAIRLILVMIPALSLHHDVKKWAAFPALGGAFFYALLSGGAVPTQRALVMVTLVFCAIVFDRRALSLRTIAWAGFIILLIEPESLLGASFQMSFAAVVGLISFYEAANERLRHHPSPAWGFLGRVGGFFLVVAMTTVVAGLLTAPLAVFHFNRIADYGVAANVLAVPLTAFWVMPWAIAAFVLMPFGAEQVALAPMGWGIDAIIAVAREVASWPGAVHLMAALPMVSLAALTLGGLWLALWRTRWRWLAAGPIGAALVLAMTARPPDVLIDGSAHLLGIRDTNGRFYFSNLRARRFVRQSWLRRAAMTKMDVRRWDDAKSRAEDRAVKPPPISCDALGCLYTHSGWRLSVATDPMALDEDCRNADVVVSLEGTPKDCAAALVIDRSDLRRAGTHALWITPQGVRVETVNGARGDRPWVLRRGDVGR